MKKNGQKVKSIKRRLLVGMVGLSVCISICCGVAASIILYQYTEKNMISSVNSSTVSYGHYVQKSIENYKTKVEAISQIKELSDPKLTLAYRKTIMQQLAKQYGFADIMICDSTGKTSNDTDVSDRDYFKASIQGETYVSSTLVRKSDSSTTLMVSTKINNGTDYFGIVIAALPADTFSKMIDDVSIGQNGYGFIVDKEGKIIAHKDRNLVTSFANYIDMAKKDRSYAQVAALVQDMTGNKKGVQTITLNGRQQCIGYTPIPDTNGWSMAASADVSEMMQEFYYALLVTGILTALFIIFSIFIAIRIATPIAKPIVSLVQRIEKLAEGDLHTEVPVIKSHDEIGILAESFTESVDNLNGYVKDISNVLQSLAAGDCTVESQLQYDGDFSEIKSALNVIIDNMNHIFMGVTQSADQVATGSMQVSSAAQSLSQGATEQASSIEELSATITEIANQVNKNASGASKANSYSQEASAEVQRGNEHMQQMVSAMHDISESSSEIGKIIKTIEDIAFQTNILALNAAVEAARAGSAGKGFAVVADEVRNLASKSAEAAKNTTALIENSIHSVEHGTKIAGETANSLNAIIGVTQKTTDLIAEIAKSSNAQAASINEVMLGVDQISAVVQTNSATSEETAATSEELSAQAQSLKEILDKLKIKEAAGGDEREAVSTEPDQLLYEEETTPSGEDGGKY